MDVDNPPTSEVDAMMETDPDPASTAAPTLGRTASSIDRDGDEQMEDAEGEGEEVYDGAEDVEIAEEDAAPEVELDEEYLEEAEAGGEDVELPVEEDGSAEEFVYVEAETDADVESTIEGTDTTITAPAETSGNEPSTTEAETIDDQQAEQGNVAVETEAPHTGAEEGHAALASSNAEVDVAGEQHGLPAEQPEAVHQDQNEGEHYDYEDAGAGGEDNVEEEDGGEEDEGVYDLLTYDTLPPIVMNLPNAQRALFNPYTPEDGEASTSAVTPVWFADKVQEYAEGTLSQLWAAIRAKLEEEGLGNDVDEMVISEKLTDLRMGDSDVNLEDITFLELVQMYHDCGLPEPMELHVEFQPHRFITRFNAIQKELQAREVVFVEDDEDEGADGDEGSGQEDDEKHEEYEAEAGEQAGANETETETEHGQLPVPLPESHQAAQPSKALTVEVTSDETTADPTQAGDNTVSPSTDENAKPTPATSKRVTDLAAAADDFELIGAPEIRAADAGNPLDPIPEQSAAGASARVKDISTAPAADDFTTVAEGGAGADTLLTSSAVEPDPVGSAGAAQASQPEGEALEGAGAEGEDQTQPANAIPESEEAQHEHGNVEVNATADDTEEYAEGEYEEGGEEYEEEQDQAAEVGDEDGEEEGDEQDPYGVDKFVDGIDDATNGDEVVNGDVAEDGAGDEEGMGHTAEDGAGDEEVYEEYEEGDDVEYEGEGEEDQEELAPDASVDPEHPHGLDLDPATDTGAATNGDDLHGEDLAEAKADVMASPVKRTRSTDEEGEGEGEVTGKRAKLAEAEPEAEA